MVARCGGRFGAAGCVQGLVVISYVALLIVDGESTVLRVVQ